MGAAPTRLPLPARLDLNAAAPLAATLRDLRGRPLVVDAAGVSHLGGQCLQVLLSAAATWADDGQPLAIDDPAGTLAALLADFGRDLALPFTETQA